LRLRAARFGFGSAAGLCLRFCRHKVTLDAGGNEWTQFKLPERKGSSGEIDRFILKQS
jgi:hypothetical protein